MTITIDNRIEFYSVTMHMNYYPYNCYIVAEVKSAISRLSEYTYATYDEI